MSRAINYPHSPHVLVFLRIKKITPNFLFWKWTIYERSKLYTWPHQQIFLFASVISLHLPKIWYQRGTETNTLVSTSTSSNLRSLSNLDQLHPLQLSRALMIMNQVQLSRIQISGLSLREGFKNPSHGICFLFTTLNFLLSTGLLNLKKKNN